MIIHKDNHPRLTKHFKVNIFHSSNIYRIFNLIIISIFITACISPTVEEGLDGEANEIHYSQQADSLIKLLSLEEKIALLHGMGGENSEFGDLDVRFFGTSGNERVGIPPLYMGHALTGVRSGRDTSIHATYFSTPIGMGCTWDPKLYSEVGKAIALEMRATGQDVNLGPTLNIIRHPLGGRNWESFSEDPYLTGKMAVSFVKSMQENGIICGPKHFVANNQERNRFDINNIVDERTLREIYLPAFKASVVEGGALNIMAAYNRVNDKFMAHNKYLLDDVLRGEWGFEGFVLSDFSRALRNTHEPVEARMNIEMHRPMYYGDSLLNEVKTGNIHEERIDILLKDVLVVMLKMGLFERERYENPEIVHSEEHIALSLKVAQNAPVLLKNTEEILPLNIKNLESVAIIGPNAKRFPSLTKENSNYGYYLQGGGSGRNYYFIDDVVDFYTGLNRALNDETKLNYAQGCKTPDLFFKNKIPEYDSEEASMISEAVALAKESEIAIVFAGLSGFNESEGRDRTSMDLPGRQNLLIQEVVKVNPNTIVVLVSGSSVNINSWVDDVKALLYVPYCGEQVGNGVAELLTGKISPSGKLPFTWAESVNDYPEGSIFTGGEYELEGKSNSYNEGIFVGYRWFEKENIFVKYPFGFGLSYTSFSIDKVGVSNGNKWPKNVRVQISNTGEMKGKEVVQLYVNDVIASVERPVKELKAFKKVELEAGETKEVEFNLPKEAFSFYDVAKKSWYLEPGKFNILIGNSSKHIVLEAEVESK